MDKKSRTDETPLFQSTAMADDVKREPKTNIAIPSEEATGQLKSWMQEGKQ